VIYQCPIHWSDSCSSHEDRSQFMWHKC